MLVDTHCHLDQLENPQIILDQAAAQIDALIDKSELAIERLREYRTALITAAVTGQIDVRPQEIKETA